MAKHKAVTHLPASAPPASPVAPAPAPRLAAQLFVAMGELVMVAICAVGIVTIVGWIMAGAELRSKERPHPSPPPTTWACLLDRHGEHCDRPPMRRHYARDGY